MVLEVLVAVVWWLRGISGVSSGGDPTERSLGRWQDPLLWLEAARTWPFPTNLKGHGSWAA